MDTRPVVCNRFFVGLANGTIVSVLLWTGIIYGIKAVFGW